jgi:hypothetical protein
MTRSVTPVVTDRAGTWRVARCRLILEESMKRLVLAALALALVVPAFAVPAMADPTDPVVQIVRPARGFIAVPTTTIYGRPNKPMVQVIILHAPAAAAAGAAHDQLRFATLARTQPGAVKP